MSEKKDKTEGEPRKPVETSREGAITEQQKEGLADQVKQEAYLAQLRARQCPGCSDSSLF